jgi:hypothetical protein
MLNTSPVKREAQYREIAIPVKFEATYLVTIFMQMRWNTFKQTIY